MLPLEVIIKINKKAVHVATVGKDFLGHNEHAFIDERIIDAPDQVISGVPALLWSRDRPALTRCLCRFCGGGHGDG
jgi:hypothetical protein